MKLRIHADSIRLRLKQSEVKALVEGGEVVETCPTSPVGLRYSLCADPAVTSLVAQCDGGWLNVQVPAGWLAGWDTDERVGFASTEGGIHLLIEKDFKCSLPASSRDNEDCYENPVACG